MTLQGALLGVLLAATATLGLHRAGAWGVPPPRVAAPLTPAAIATARLAAAPRTAPTPAARPTAVAAETEDVLPPGPARSDVFAACTGCHASAIIRRSALTRDRWDELMDWMTEKHGMPALEGEQRLSIVDYLAQNFAPRRSRVPSPFQTE